MRAHPATSRRPLLVALAASLGHLVGCVPHDVPETPGERAADAGALPDREDPGGDTVEDAGSDAGTIDPVDTSSGLDSRPANPTCVAGPRPAQDTNITLTRVYPALSLDRPLFLLERPGDAAHFYAIERAGRVVRWAKDDDGVTAPEVWCDLRSRVATSDSGNTEQGLLGIAFHPEHAANGELYLSYTAEHDNAGCALGPTVTCPFESRVSRLTVDDDSGCNLESEVVLLDVDDFAGNHNGGHLAFDSTGMLLVAMGDGGGSNDPLDAGQRLDLLLGKILRIDVDRSSEALPYSIPTDNPFVHVDGARPEVWALGLRNPWRFSVDRDTGTVWAGDVGQTAIEEIHRIEAGGNYGWSVFEGISCFMGDARCDDGGFFLPPVVFYPHQNGRVSVTGGYVYRGRAIEALRGTYLFADFASKEIFAMTTDAYGGSGFEVRATMSGGGIASFSEDAAGEIYVVDLGGALYRLDPPTTTSSTAVEPDAFPKTLSATGCMDPDDTSRFGPGVVPYQLNHGFYSDGASKERGMALPDGATARIESSGDITFPVGTVLFKTFRMGAELIETRLLMRHPDGEWAGYSYAWDGDDATLVDAGGRTVTLANGQRWSIPSRAGCMVCHTAVAGRALGPEVGQLNGDLTYPQTGRTANQLLTLGAIGMLENPIADVSQVARLPSRDDEGATVEQRARALLHVNCSMCHRPGGGAQGDADMRWSTPLESSSMCGAPPSEGDLGAAGAQVLSPGDPARSMVSIRMKRLGAGRMPLLGSNVVDADGVALVDAWIASTPSCPQPAP